MKRLLLNSLILCLWMGLVFFSCSNENARGKSVGGNETDTAGKNRSAPGNTVNSQQSNTVNPGRDTVLQYKTEVRNNGPDQSRIDSIKNAKTRKKK
ncbi:MAG: hypothetical protein NTW10_07420 [Bacteroidetes bacterium]|nr:hypothetical protein [Bacteroidota bacterium]